MPVHKILLVEDDELSARLMRFLIEREGYSMHHASDGRSALAMAQDLCPDMLILDINLPDIDGFAVLAELQQHIARYQTKVLMLTGKASDADMVKATQLGACGYLIKPFQPAELISKIQSVW